MFTVEDKARVVSHLQTNIFAKQMLKYMWDVLLILLGVLSKLCQKSTCCLTYFLICILRHSLIQNRFSSYSNSTKNFHVLTLFQFYSKYLRFIPHIRHKKNNE